MSERIIGIIPARGGSKTVPRKNIKLLANKPLIAYTIESAVRSKHLQRIVVSTEDKEISEVSTKFGAEVMDRPDDLAADESPTIDVLLYIFDVLKENKSESEIIVLLQPTSPLRTSQDIDNAIELYQKVESESLVSVCEINHSPYWSFNIKDKYLKNIFGDQYLHMQRQELPKAYMPNGAIFISTPEYLQKYRSFYSSKTIPYIMPPERSIDIDNEIDFILAELLIKRERGIA